MAQEVEIRVRPEEVKNEALHKKTISKQLGDSPGDFEVRLLRRSLDARRGQLLYVLRFAVIRPGEPAPERAPALKLQNVSAAPEVIVVGCGPSGIFAALRLIELGLRPILLERGKAVRERRRDIAALTKQGVVDPDSNYCFGEGGAGTFSDGKLYTRSQKRGSVARILSILADHGADPEILIDAHPHIGTNRLPAVITALTKQIVDCGGSVLFGKRVSEILKDGKGVSGVTTASGEKYAARAVVLASGHSARDIFTMLHNSGIAIERKPFALGVRVEHPQPLVDEIQYGRSASECFLPSAAYALKAQSSGRGVFSFCMCPGGIICPAATAGNEIVVNGWSPSKRNSRYANSGIVVEIPEASFDEGDLFAGVRFQERVEQRAFEAGGGKQVAPAQRLTDFVERRISQDVPDNSYLPGTISSNLYDVLPPEVAERLREGFLSFGKQLRGYLTNEAVILAPESRTSSPIRIPRDSSTLMHTQLRGLFPCGEGGGFAGGIVSAAIDGERSASAVASFLA